MKENDIKLGTQKKPMLSWSFIDMLAILSVVTMAILILFFPYKHYKDSCLTLEDTRSRLAELTMAKNEEMQRLKNQEELTARLKARKPDFTLFSYLNTVLTDNGLKDRADLKEVHPNPNDKKNTLGQDVTSVQLTIKGVSLKELVDLLHTIYASENLVVMERLDSLQAAPDNHGIDCTLVLLTPKQKPNAA